MKPLFLDLISTTEAVMNSGFIPAVLVIVVVVIVVGIVINKRRK